MLAFAILSDSSPQAEYMGSETCATLKSSGSLVHCDTDIMVEMRTVPVSDVHKTVSKNLHPTHGPSTLR